MASENNTGYANIWRQAAGNEVRKRLGFKKGKYEAGEVWICRLYRNKKEGQFHANIRWTGLDNLDGRVMKQPYRTSRVQEMSEL